MAKKNNIDPNHGYDLSYIALVEKQIKNEKCWCDENGEEE